jgi:hypothetical protein
LREHRTRDRCDSCALGQEISRGKSTQLAGIRHPIFPYLRCHLVVHPPVTRLHFFKPIQFPLHFIKHIWDGISRLRDVPEVVGKLGWKHFIAIEESPYGGARVQNVFRIITSIKPPANIKQQLKMHAIAFPHHEITIGCK